MLIEKNNEISGMDNIMSFYDHIREVKNRMLFVVTFFILMLLLSYFTTPFLLSIVRSFAESSLVNLNVFKVTESVSIYAKIMLIQSICYTVPFIILQLYNFIKPTLNKQTKRAIITFSIVVSLLFTVGLVLGFILLVPILITFFLGVTAELGMNTVYSFSDYFQFVFMICAFSGIVLQVPPLLVFLVQLKVLSYKLLIKLRLPLYVLFVFVGVLITPPDFISDLIAIGLLILMFEISIIICRFVEMKNSTGEEV